jgi:5-methylcytosine-specific restriction endonuclease McrA
MPKRIYDWTAIQRYHDEGHGFVECQKRFGFCHTAWVKAIKRGTLRSKDAPFVDRRRKYDWAAVQRFYDEGHSVRGCISHFGFTLQTWHKARRRGEIQSRSHGMPIAQLLRGRRQRGHVKVRLLRAGLLHNRCDFCGLTEWRGKRLSMHIDHINGVRDDHRLENLRMLCPNCHSQTDTYGGRNIKRRDALHEGVPAL